MTKKDLNKLKELRRTILTKQEELIRLKSSAEGMSMNLNTEKVQFQGKDKSETILNIVEAQTDLSMYIEAYNKAKEIINKAIRTLDDQLLIHVIAARYMRGARWDEIAQDMHYDVSWVHRLHIKALKDLEDIEISLNEEVLFGRE